MTTDREALAAGLETWDGYEFVPYKHGEVVVAAAHKYLAQLPEKCGTCGGDGEALYNRYNNEYTDCSTCHGRGTVYPPALVERIEQALRWFGPEDVAIAVLDALNSELQPPTG